MDWSRLNVIPVVLQGPFVGLPPGATVANLDFKWRDGWLFALGGEYDWSRALTLRAGAAYEISPVDGATTRLVQDPDSDRVWAALLEKEAADLKAQAEADRLARVKIEARIAPRSLTQVQQNELTGKLSSFKNVRGTIIASPSTQESEWFARTLGAPLKEAGWEMTILPGTATATVLHPTGLVVWYPMGQHVMERGLPNPGPAASLAEALNELGIAASALPGIVEPPNTIAVVIGAK